MKRLTNDNITEQQLLQQLDFIKKVKKINDDAGGQKKYLVSTFGCQMNAHDSEKLSGILREMGYSKAADEKDADLVLYNTCCVRENAENKVYGKIGFLKHIKQSKPGFKIVLCGCMMQQDAVVEKIKSSYRQVDIIFGTYNLYRFPELLHTNIETGSMVIDVWNEHGEIVEDLPSIREFKYKAGINIMYGCNNFCTYCIVPYVRGRERSRTPEDILKEAQTLANDGVKEIMLLGQNVNSYGLGLEEKIDFAGLLRRVHDIKGIERIRFMTSHPKDLSDELIYAMRDLDKVCNHLHLPFQSGSTEILKKMNRKYTKESYLGLIKKLKSEIPEISLTTDILIGFPGETEEDFLETLDVAKTVRFNSAFTFLYSKRSGTPAAAMDCQISDEIAKERFQRLLDVINPIVFEINQTQINKIMQVIPESLSEGILSGRTEDNSLVHFKGGEALLGKTVAVKITEAKPFYLMGELVSDSNIEGIHIK